MSDQVKTIGVLTSGGDAPGMNAAIRAVVRAGYARGMKVMGIERGYAGLLNEEIREMRPQDVSNIIERGGTILLTARCKEFMEEAGQKKGAEICRKYGIDGIVVIGGDGSYQGAIKLSENGVNTIGIPGTIDLDIACTEYTIGFDTAVNTAMEAIDRLRDTSSSHERCSIVEVMGRHAGHIAIWAGLSTGAEDILMPEDFDGNIDRIVEHVKESRRLKKTHHLIINAEGNKNSQELADRIEAETGISTRATILGHIQRGGSPTCRDRVTATLMGVKAVDLLKEGKTNRAVCMRDGRIIDMDLGEALAMQKSIDPDLLNARALLKR